MTKHALIVGVGAGLSASLARKLKAEGYDISLASRSETKFASIARETAAKTFLCDASQIEDVAKLFTDLDTAGRTPEFVCYNASGRTRGPIAELDPKEVLNAITVSAFGGFLVGQQAAKRMISKGNGAIFFTGASASMKGFALSAPFAMGKFALRGLAQSMARELQPKGIHVAHFNIDGGIRSSARPVPAEKPDSLLDPDAIAQTYIDVLKQQRSAWSLEVELRPWVETF
jgi:short-subunit dehydrogenase